MNNQKHQSIIDKLLLVSDIDLLIHDAELDDVILGRGLMKQNI